LTGLHVSRESLEAFFTIRLDPVSGCKPLSDSLQRFVILLWSRRVFRILLMDEQPHLCSFLFMSSLLANFGLSPPFIGILVNDPRNLDSRYRKQRQNI
jgi:hypothetical protein